MPWQPVWQTGIHEAEISNSAKSAVLREKESNQRTLTPALAALKLSAAIALSQSGQNNEPSRYKLKSVSGIGA